jgi:putative lipoic acid-binding regulatory protein
MGAVITTQQSKTGKFTSISISVTMPNAQSVIDKYIAVSDIEGIISL